MSMRETLALAAALAVGPAQHIGHDDDRRMAERVAPRRAFLEIVGHTFNPFHNDRDRLTRQFAEASRVATRRARFQISI